MIIFLDLTEQIHDTENLTEKEYSECLEFAWYETITDKILSFNGENVWSFWEDFKSDFLEMGVNLYDIRRFENLRPPVVVETTSIPTKPLLEDKGLPVVDEIRAMPPVKPAKDQQSKKYFIIGLAHDEIWEVVKDFNNLLEAVSYKKYHQKVGQFWYIVNEVKIILHKKNE